jgi:hypothetical protein
MHVFTRLALMAALGALYTAASAQDAPQPVQFSGQLWLQNDTQSANTQGPLAQANRLKDGIAPLTPQRTTALAELRARHPLWNATATAEQEDTPAGASARSRMNELALHHDKGAWQFSAGKKIVSWDVGYAFRPNDMVQQENRRTLANTTPEGRGLVMAEYFGDDASWSMAWVNPGDTPERRGALEPAVALRYFQRTGAADWHGFARLAERTGASLGVAGAWVADEAWELHGSLRQRQRYDTLGLSPQAAAIATTSPWQARTADDALQALVGTTWTSASQVSLLLEAWYDGTALRNDEWAQWRSRNSNLVRLAGLGAPGAAIAGNLAWQGDALSANPNLQRNNLFARISRDVEAWQLALDVLLHPDDGGQMLTASATWKGDRTQLQAALRSAQGPRDSLLMQLPAREQAYVRMGWAF